VIHRRWSVGAVLVGLVLVGACKKPVATGPDPLPDGPIHVDAVVDPFSEQGLQALVAELRPLVEKHAGRRFREDPVVEVFDAAAFGAYAKREARLITDTIYRDTPEPIRAAHAEEYGQISAGGLFGKYGLFDRKTYLVPETIRMAGAEIGPDGPLRLAKLVLAHELTHALQNQEVDGAAQLATLNDLDHVHCWSSVSEGGANFVAIRVARELGLEADFWTLSSHQGWSEQGLEQPAAYDTWMRYGRGMDMLEEVVAAGGMDAFWAWHAAPPASSSAIFRPSTYSPEVPDRSLDWAAVLRGTEQALTTGDWMASNTRLGEYTLRGEAIRTGHEADFEPLLAHLVDAQRLELLMADRGGDIRVMVFDAPEHARAYLELLRAEQTEEGRRLAKSIGRTVEVTYTEVSGVQGDSSLLRTQRIAGDDGISNEVRTAWVARGADVVAVEATKFRPGVRLAATLNAVFAQLDAVRSGAGG
jgi:hypothetical protein